MKNAIKALVLVAIFAIAGIANAQNSASTNGTATAHIIHPVTITMSPGGLQFGNVIPPNSGTGTEVISPAGASTYSPAGMKPGTQLGTQSAATFTITAEPSMFIDITRSGVATLKDPFGDPAIIADTFTTDAPANPVADGVTGTIVYHVGGTLHVPAGTIASTYSTTNPGGSGWTETAAYH